MHAKLVVGASAGNIYQCIRDMCRLLTSTAPSLSDLSGAGFSTTASAVLDNTPAGWTFAGSAKTVDQAGIAPGTADATFATTTYVNWGLWAPMAGNPDAKKYANLTQACQDVAGNTLFALNAATFISTTGAVTNQGFRVAAGTNSTGLAAANFSTSANSVFHLIANPRHITLIREGTGLMGVWETSVGEINTFQGSGPAFCSYSHATSSNVTISTSAIPTSTVTSIVGGTVYNLTDPNTGTFYGTYSPLAQGVNSHYFYQGTLSARANTYDAAGNPRYQITPVFINLTNLGYPTAYVTGVVPIYWCRAGLGNTGDTVSVAGEDYKYFNCGASGSAFGVLMKTN